MAAQMKKTITTGGQRYKHYWNYNTKTDAKYASKALHNKGWKVRIIEYKDVPGRLDVVYAIYRKRMKTPKPFNVASHKAAPAKKRSGVRVIIRRRK